MDSNIQGKVFIVTGTLGLIVSLYVLISAVIPDRKNNQKIIDIPTQELESIETIEESDIDFTQLLLEGSKIEPLYVLIPEFLLTSGFTTIAANLQETRGIQVIFKTLQKVSEYKKINDQRYYEDEQIDIMIAPMDYIQTRLPNTQAMPIAEPITPYYHTIFAHYLDKNEYTLIPHAIDPLLIFSQTVVDPWLYIEDRIENIIYREAPKRFHIPIIFGVSAQDINFMKQGRDLFEDQVTILYHIIQYAGKGETAIDKIKTLLDIVALGRNDVRSTADFITISSRLNERNSNCKTYPSICVFIYKFANHRIGFMSDINKINRHFNTNNNDYQTHVFRHEEEYPVRGRAIIANKESEKNTRISYFLDAYVQGSLVQIDPGLRNHTIPASTIANTTINNPNTQGALYETNNNRSMIVGNTDSMQNFMQEYNVRNLFEGGYNPELFISNLQ